MNLEFDTDNRRCTLITITLASSTIDSVGAGSLPSSPLQLQQAHKRDTSVAGLDASPDAASFDSPQQHSGDEGSGKKRPVKRACNECRQQKLRCNVVQEPFQTCSRCKRLNLDCKIEENFKRVGKRSRNAEMEREIIELRKQVAAQHASGPVAIGPAQTPQLIAGANEAAAGLLDLRDGRGRGLKKLGDVVLTVDRIRDLFDRFFKFCHPFLPFLNPEKPPEDYLAKSPLLFWTIVLIGSRHYQTEEHLFGALARQVQTLAWSTISDVPQNYHVIKALILLCAWPLPCSSTSTDQTWLLAGMMMQIALQIGLHRPDHAQDFTKFRIDIRQAELQDRVVTWTVCNMTAQRIATAYGQPASTIYDWTLGPKPIVSNPNYELPKEIYHRLQIERFVDKVSKTIYTNPSDPLGLPDDDSRAQLVKLLSEDLKELEEKLRADQSDESVITTLYVKAASLHLCLSAFFSHKNLTSYRSDMLKCYHATINFLEACLSLESAYSVNLPSNYQHGLSLAHGTNYIFHMMLAAGFSLLKLMYHFLPQHELDTQGARELLTRTLWALRSCSVMENDLAERLSEVLAQVWKSGPRKHEARPNNDSEEPSDELQLKVRCRMSMSLVFDSVWRWRKNFRDQRPPPARYFNAEGSGQATDPTTVSLSNGTTTAVSSSNTSNRAGDSTPTIPGMAGMATGIADDYGTDPYGSSSYEVFDPLNWMLDGTVDFPFNFANAGMESLNALAADI